MSDTTAAPTAGSLTSLRWFLGLSGVLAVIIGLMMMIWPGLTAIVATTVIAIYAIIEGVFYIGAAITSSRLSGWARIGLGVAGLVFLVAGIIAFLNPATSAATLAVIVMTLVAIAWIIEGVAALATLRDAPSKGWAIFFAIVSIIAGIGLLCYPLFSGIVLWVWLGISLVVIGVVQIVRAFNVGR